MMIKFLARGTGSTAAARQRFGSMLRMIAALPLPDG